jgi:hypothetical protein
MMSLLAGRECKVDELALDDLRVLDESTVLLHRTEDETFVYRRTRGEGTVEEGGMTIQRQINQQSIRMRIFADLDNDVVYSRLSSAVSGFPAASTGSVMSNVARMEAIVIHSVLRAMTAVVYHYF